MNLLRLTLIALGAVIASWGTLILVANQSAAQKLMSPSFGAQRLLSPSASERILEIRVQGIQRIDPETVRSYMHIRAGEPFDAARIDQSLKSLFSTGLFADVSIRRDKNILIVKVIENPIINQLAFEGLDFMDEEELRKEVKLRSRVVYTRTRVQNDVKRIIDLYSRQGRFAVIVIPKIIQRPQNRVDLIFEIDEGQPTLIQKITFIGNKAYSDSRLRSVIQSGETSFYAFLTADDVYDPDRIRVDEELLRRYYFSLGYADFRVLSSTAELSRDRKDFFITFTVDEGVRYRLGSVEVKSELKGLDARRVDGVITVSKDDWYNGKEVDVSVSKLTDAVSALGFAFIDIRSILKRDKGRRIVSVIFRIREGPRLFVERINITGNVRTLDKVIRRELRLAEGDAFNRSRFNRSQGKVRGLGYFKTQKFSRRPGSAKDKTIIDIEVEEQSTGSFVIGAGFSSSDGLITQATLTERNLLGKGQRLTIGASLGSQTQNFDIGFTEPYFLERNLSASVNVFKSEIDGSDTISFSRSLLGMGFGFGFAYNDRLRQRLNYRLESKDIFDLDDDASIFVQQQEGESVTSAIGQSITYDVRDSRSGPTEGYVIRLSNSLAGFGGDTRYLKSEISGAVYYRVAGDWVLRLGGEVGYNFGIGKDIRIDDRFFIGGDGTSRVLRGFAVAGIGPRDEDSDDALGGNVYATSTAEVSLPIGNASAFETRGFLFADMGTLMMIDDSDQPALDPDDPLCTSTPPSNRCDGSKILEDDTLRLSVGIGVGVKTPFGVIRLNYAIPLLKADFDKLEAFTFRFGTAF